MLVLIENDREEVDGYLYAYGIGLMHNAVYGLILHGSKSNEDELPTTNLERTYYKLVKAFKNTDLDDAMINMYIGNLSDDVIDKLKMSGFDINDDNVLRIFQLDYDIYVLLENMFKHSLDETIKRISDIILDYWPKATITPHAATRYELDSVIWSPRFDYVQGASKFHSIVPVPFDSLYDSYTHCLVLVEVKENKRGSLYDYTVTLANSYDIETDVRPTDKNIIELTIGSITWKYKLDRMYRKFKSMVKL